MRSQNRSTKKQLQRRKTSSVSSSTGVKCSTSGILEIWILILTNPDYCLTFKAFAMIRLLLMVALYYPLSVGLTFYQKWFIKHYRLPLLIVAGHYVTKLLLATTIRSVVEWAQKNRRVRVPLQEQFRWLMPIGFCASLDIGLSNWSLEYVTISLYTMAKSSSILFIVAFSLLLRLERWRASLGTSAILIAFGLFLFTWRSTQLDMWGLLLVELAALCTGIRWTISQLIMQGEECATPIRHPLDIMIAVQPWMLVAIVPIVVVVEGPELTLQTVTSFYGAHQPGLVLLLILFGGVLAFLMEFAEYLLLVNTSGITLSILGIVKEGISLLLAHYLHNDHLSTVNIAGLALCVLGMVLHSVRKAQHRHFGSVGGGHVPPPSICSSCASSASAVGSSNDTLASVGRKCSSICATSATQMMRTTTPEEQRRKLLPPEQTIV
uniref:Sugar phosphate transporter domain-containing protein n=1 Tax=Globodera rostochiensis TaxID=31243 RepID=A0A914I854_GLORO